MRQETCVYKYSLLLRRLGFIDRFDSLNEICRNNIWLSSISEQVAKLQAFHNVVSSFHSLGPVLKRLDAWRLFCWDFPANHMCFVQKNIDGAHLTIEEATWCCWAFQTVPRRWPNWKFMRRRAAADGCKDDFNSQSHFFGTSRADLGKGNYFRGEKRYIIQVTRDLFLPRLWGLHQVAVLCFGPSDLLLARERNTTSQSERFLNLSQVLWQWRRQRKESRLYNDVQNCASSSSTKIWFDDTSGRLGQTAIP